MLNGISRFSVVLSVLLFLALPGPAAWGVPPDVEIMTVTSPDGSAVTLIVPRSSIRPEELGVIVNTSDPQSVAVADYYRVARNIPDENIIHVSFPPGSTTMSQSTFENLKVEVDAAAGPDIQAFAISWTTPWRVECMSLTSAFALGFSFDYCSSPCQSTQAVDYFGSDSVKPFVDHGIRPAMILGGTSVENAIALIDKSVSADQTFPGGDGYFLRTTDSLRSVRWPDFAQTVDAWNRPDGLAMYYIDNSDGTSSNYLEFVDDVLFYFTGLATVPQIDTNTYVPGAVADHMTSYGGQLTSGGQTSILRWLEAGASASYGTVVEPCNYKAKFPQTSFLIPPYFGGGTIVEAYWKSVRWPGEGLFAGDPLTRPYGTQVSLQDGTLELLTTILKPGSTYSLQEADSVDGPFRILRSDITVADPTFTTILEPALSPVYALIEEQPDVDPPTAAVTSPAPGTVVSGSIFVTADASDNVGVATVELYVSGAIGGVDDTEPYSFMLDSTSYDNGVYDLVARSIDGAGNVGDSTPVDIEIENPPPCDNDGVCEAGEDCDLCPGDCLLVTGPICGDGICQITGGEDCLSCPADCMGKQRGRPSRMFCCGAGAGINPVGCGDPRCSSGSETCSAEPVQDSCAGDGICGGYEDSCNSPVDCGVAAGAEAPGATCDDGVDNDCDGSVDCDDPDCDADQNCVNACVPTSTKENGRRCRDGLDNDCDGLRDAADPDCER
jgi:uncharacterized protein (TIGR03790 family)